MSTDPHTPAQWAIVELMGHRRVIGTIRETQLAGAPMLEITAPDGTRQIYAPSALYCVTPVTEDQARAMLGAGHMHDPLAAIKALPGADEWLDDIDDELDDESVPL